MNWITRPRPEARIVLAIVAVVIALGALAPLAWASTGNVTSPDEHGEALPFTEEELVTHVFSLARKYFADFRHPDTHVLYGARLSTKRGWTSPDDVKAEKPEPWGYGSRICDTSLHCGHMLVALLDAHEARPDSFLKENIEKTFRAIRLIGSLPETHPKPGKPALVGLVPRGPHPDDMTAYYDDSSMDQHTTYIISLARYANSSLASEEDKAWIRQSLEKVGRRLEKNGWSIKRADGQTQAHVGFTWTGYNSQHASILLPAVYALYKGTGDKHWLKTFETFIHEKDDSRWKQLYPGPHVRINAHPIYANQGAFRLNALYHLDTNPQRRAVIRDLLSYSAELQMARAFPGPMYRKFHSLEAWQQLRRNWNWADDELQGSEEAWAKFQVDMLDDPLAVLAHVRFPLAGFHMVLMSENPEMIRAHLARIWEMLNAVDLGKVDAGETNYLFTVAGLHVYAFHFRSRKQLAAKVEPVSYTDETDVSETFLPIVGDAGIGPTIDVTVDGDLAYAIGRGVLRVLDVSQPLKPQVLGQLSGLGNTRQLVARQGIVYVGSREDGVFVIDATDPARPRLLTRYDSVEFATGVGISGDVLFLACRHYGVELVDVSMPDKPVHLSTVRTGEAQSVSIRNGFLYAGVWGTSEVVAVDVRNPRRPQITARVPLDGYGDGLDVSGEYLYAATGHHGRAKHREPGDPGFGRGHGLEVLDISDPAHPTFVSRVKFPPFYKLGNDMWGVTVVDGLAFVADTHNGMFLVDVADARHPRVIGRCLLPRVEGSEQPSFVGSLALVDDYVYVAGGWSDLHVVAAPKMARAVTKELDTPPVIPQEQPEKQDDRYRLYQTDGQVHAVDFLDDKAVVACGDSGVHLLQLRPAIKKLATLSTQGFATDVSVQGRQVFVAEGAGGLSIWEISQQDTPTCKGRHLAKRGAVKQVEVPPPGRYAIVQVGGSTFQIIDVGSPATPKPVLSDNRLGLLYGDQLMRGLVDNCYTAAFWHVSGIHWYDLSNEEAESAPSYSGDNHPERFGASNGLVAHGERTLVTTRRGGYVLLDRQERRPFAELTFQPVGTRHQNLGKPTIFDGQLYAADRATGLVTIADVSDPKQPKLIEQFVTPGHPGRIHVCQGIMVIPDGNHGLMVFDH